jgi:hypothetical protein
MKTKSYKHLRNQMSSERRERNVSRVQASLIYMALQELQQSVGITEDAAGFDLTQPVLSQLEHQEDIQISTLTQFIESLGGQLKLVACFPDREVVINLTNKS